MPQFQLYAASLFATHGLPEEIVADNGPQFVAGEMKDFLTANGVSLCFCSPYHPESNGEAERAVRTFQEAMRIMKNEPGTQTEKLQRFLLRYRTTPHTATGCPPAEILMGRRLRTRLEFLRPDLSSRIEQKSRKMNPMARRGLKLVNLLMLRNTAIVDPFGQRVPFKIDWVRSRTECKLESCSGRDISISCENQLVQR